MASNLFRGEPVITDKGMFTTRVYEFLDSVNVGTVDLTTVNARLTALEAYDVTLTASIAAIDTRVDTLEVNDNYRRTFMMMGG